VSFERSLGFGWLEAIHPDDRDPTQRAWSEAQKKGEYYIEHRVRREADREHLWHQTRAKPIEGENSGSSDWVGTRRCRPAMALHTDGRRIFVQEVLLEFACPVAVDVVRNPAKADSEPIK